MSLFIGEPESSSIIVVFTGMLVADNTKFDFFKTINTIPKCNKLFLRDSKQLSYHYGIDGISSNIDETVEYLRSKLTGFSNIIFTGYSGGGYAAILFGSLLNVSRVITFKAPTLIKHPKTTEMYRNLSQHINNTTNYQLYYDPDTPSVDRYHHISNYSRVEGKQNVQLNKYNFSMRKFVESGDILNIFTQALINIQ